VIGQLSDFVKGKPFKEISKDDIAAFLKHKRNNKAVAGKYAYEKGLSKSSYSMFILVLKIFYRWLYGLPRHHYPQQVDDLNPSTQKTQPIQPSEIITKEDIVKVLEHCKDFREKALVSCLYESANRASEFLGWRIGDVVFDRRGAVLNVGGKTGERRIRLIECVPHLQQWLQTHPKKSDKNAFVWSFRGKRKHAYKYLRRLLKKPFKNANINKPCNPHAFRHSRLTELAKYLSDGKLKVFAGWTGSSRMAGTYVHLSGADLDDDLLKAAGVETAVEQKVSPLKTKVCSRCERLNPGEAQYCLQCGLPFNPEEIISTEVELETKLKRMEEQLNYAFKEIQSMKKGAKL